ncbi:hypothetical protein [Pseudomonas sp. GOM6]|uniref:hypothetical protein n=1 Tax=Pseudomonas sp. GOM6 TaxID=3036944 RepID=UPI0024094B9C|nr:hypothetical protein [Pseudomonas sp. GOM6]MDG1582935.1 hypothetical protein [Pseudomonas sp. GOM6]
MVIHYSTAPDSVACGRTGSSLNTTTEQAQVSCKLCLRAGEKKAQAPVNKTPSLAELRAAAKAAKAEPVTVAATPAPAPRKSVRSEWAQRLEQLPGRNRLPRGVARQSVS